MADLPSASITENAESLARRCDECGRGNHGICERPGSCVCTCWEVTVNDYPVA